MATYHVESITDEGSRLFAAETLAHLANEHREQAERIKARLQEMPRPTLRDGFPAGYREVTQEYRRAKAAEHAIVEAAEYLGVVDLFNPVYNRNADYEEV